jgi:hypothetical protein
MNANAKKGIQFLFLAILVEGCALWGTPTPDRIVPQQENIVPQDQIPDESRPDGPVQGDPRPDGDIRIEFLADPPTIQPGQCARLRWSVQGGFFSVRLDGQPVDPIGERQACPKSTTVYRLEVDAGDQMIFREAVIAVGGSGPGQPTKANGPGPGPTPTVTKSVPVIQTVLPFATQTVAVPVIQTVLPLQMVDLAVTKIFPNASGKIMMTIKNSGTVKVTGSYQYVCSGSFTDSAGNHALNATKQFADVDMAPGQSSDYDTGYSRNPSITEMWVSCKLTPPAADAVGANNSLGMTKVK